MANMAIILTEYINSTTPGDNWFLALPKTIGLIIVAQFCLYHSFSNAPSNWMLAWATFTVGNSIMRLLFVYLVDNHGIDSWGRVVMGVSCILFGALFMKSGLH
jgi:hypothetical protein